MRITAYAVRKRIAIFVIACGMTVLGLYGLWSLPVAYLPDVTYPLIKLNIGWTGATPDELDKNVADPVERIMATVDGVDSLESSIIEGMYALDLNFRYGVNVDIAYQDALAALARATKFLPQDISAPVMFKADPTQFPIVQIAVQSAVWDQTTLRTWAENSLEPFLTAVPGVGGTEIIGGLRREIRVALDADALIKHDLGVQKIIDALRTENVEQFGGRVVQGDREFIARTTGEFANLDDIRNIVVLRQGDSKVLLKDIAVVEDSHEDVRIVTRFNGEPGLKISVLKQADANTVAVAKEVQTRLEQLKESLPEGLSIGLVENQATYVEASINGVRSAAIDAAALVILVIYLFLGSWRQVVLMSLLLPTTLIINFGLMRLGGFSLNIFSLGGLVVAIGVVLDNATVVLENITRLRAGKTTESIASVAERGTDEVSAAIVAATISFLALFLPFLLVPGMTSLLFKELILVISGIVVLSLVIAVSLAPMLATLLMGNTTQEKGAGKIEAFHARIAERYAGWLQTMLNRRKLVLALFTIMLVGSIALVPRVGSEFLPKIDDGRILVKVRLATGVSVEKTNTVLQSLERFLVGDPLIEAYFVMAGGKIVGINTIEVASEGQIDIQLVPRGQRKTSTQEYINALRARMSKAPVAGGRIMISQQKMRGIRSIGSSEIEIKIHGGELDVLESLANEALSKINSTPGLTNAYISLDMSRPEFQVKIDRIRAAELGVSAADVSASLRTLVAGTVATRFRDKGEYYDIRLMVPEFTVNNAVDIGRLPVRTAFGNHVRISDVAEVRQALGPVEITRENQIKQIIVRADTAGISIGEGRDAIAQAINQKLPVGYSIEFGGQAQMMKEMMRSLSLVVVFALFFAFIVLSVQFNSFKLPGLILLSVPFCSAGMIYALLLSGLPLGATVIIGALLVISSTVNEGVLLITYAEDLRTQEGLRPVDAIIKAGKLRLRPRLMIAVTVIAGFIPLALNIEEGSDMLQPMAVAGIGGLLTGIIVALFLVPCLYVLFTPEKHTSAKRKVEPKAA